MRATLADAGQDGWGAAATASSAVLGAVFLLLIAMVAALAYSSAGSENHMLTSADAASGLLPQLGSCALKDLDGQKLQAFVSSCDCNSKTIRNLVATLRMMWSSARAWSYVAHHPFEGLVLPKRGLVQTFTLSLEEIKRIVGTARDPYITFFSILAETGIGAAKFVVFV